jgi:hypothetical protein
VEAPAAQWQKVMRKQNRRIFTVVADCGTRADDRDELGDILV